MGEATGPAELHPFGTRVRDKRDRWEEAVRAILPMFTKEDWEFHGQFHDFPARNVIPKSRQKPHPPLWVACSNIQTIAKAGEWGMGALGFSFVSPEAARAWVHRYYNNFLHNRNRLTEYKDNPNIAVVSGFMCAPTDEEARELAAGWTFFIFALGYYGRAGVDAPGKSNLWGAYQEWRKTDKAQAALNSALVGSPETLRKKLHQFHESHVDQVILLNQAGKTTHKAICNSLELFAKEVMPEFHALTPSHETWKSDVLSGRIVLENLATDGYDIYAHQNEHIVRLTPEQLKAKRSSPQFLLWSVANNIDGCSTRGGSRRQKYVQIVVTKYLTCRGVFGYRCGMPSRGGPVHVVTTTRQYKGRVYTHPSAAPQLSRGRQGQATRRWATSRICPTAWSTSCAGRCAARRSCRPASASRSSPPGRTATPPRCCAPCAGSTSRACSARGRAARPTWSWP